MTDKTCITLPPPRRNSLSLSLRAALLRFSLFFSSSFSAPTCVHVRLDIHTPPPPPDAVLSQGAALHRCPAWRYTSRNSNFIVIFINWVARVNAPAVPPDGLQLFVILKFNAALRVPSSPTYFRVHTRTHAPHRVISLAILFFTPATPILPDNVARSVRNYEIIATMNKTSVLLWRGWKVRGEGESDFSRSIRGIWVSGVRWYRDFVARSWKWS